MIPKSECVREIVEAIEEYKTGFLWMSALSREQMDCMAQRHTEFLEALMSSSSDVLLFSMGSYVCLDRAELLDQQLPSYILDCAQVKKTEIMLLDMQFNVSAEDMQWVAEQDLRTQVFLHTNRASFQPKNTMKHRPSFTSTSHPNLELSAFGVFLLPYESAPKFWTLVKNAFEKKLNAGGTIFIASHLNMYDLDFAPAMITIYNELKAQHGRSIQLYIQGDLALVFYYPAQYEKKEVDRLIEQFEDSGREFGPREFLSFYKDCKAYPSMEDMSKKQSFVTSVSSVQIRLKALHAKDQKGPKEDQKGQARLVCK